MSLVRTRIAPSPTGDDLHIGNAYTALINYVFARKHGGQFIIRIEDTDRTRLVDGSEQRIIQSLDWLGIPYDEGPDIGGPHAPYRQSERLDVYKKYAELLVEKGHAYYCFCTQERLEEMRKGQEARDEPPMYDGHCKAISQQPSAIRAKQGERHVIRLNVPDDGVTEFDDLIRGKISFENKLIDDQVLLKSDGYPTYHLGVVVDDHIMEISHIIRGEEWISSAPKHVLLYQFLGWNPPVFAHVPLLRNIDKSKLSKRKNPVWVSWFRDNGFLPEAICNYLALMAWAHPEGKEIFDTNEFIKKFTLEKIQTTAPVFDTEKLRWMNGEYLRSLQPAAISKQLYEFYNLKYPIARIIQILPLVRERIKTLKEFGSLAGFFFEKPKEFEKPFDPKMLKLLKVCIESIEWNHEALEAAIRKLADDQGLKAKDVFMQLRLVVTGKTVGPPLLESLEILGKEEILGRLSI